MATITDGTGSVSPALIHGWDAARASRNVVHRLIDRSTPEVTLRPSEPPAGTLSLFFATYTEAVQAVQLHAGAVVLTLTPTGGDPAIGMVYVLSDSAGVQLAPAMEAGHTDTPWVVTVPFQAIA